MFEQKCLDKVKEAYDFVESLGFKVWVVNLYGSQNYNMATAGSDYDFKAVVFPTLDDVVANRDPVSKVYNFQGGQVDVKDVRLMWNNYKKQNPNFMETLFTPYFYVNPAFLREWLQVRGMANEVAYADPVRAMNAMVGMAMEKCHALCHPYESKVELLKERGYDAKQLSHEYRLKFMLEKFVNRWSYGSLLLPEASELEFLMRLKTYTPQLRVEDAKAMAAECVEEMGEMKKAAFETYTYSVNEDVYARLDAVKSLVLKRVFREELMNEMA